MTKMTSLVITAVLFTVPLAADVIYLNSGQQYYGHLDGRP